VGGFSFTVNEKLRLYLVETAQKGMHWMKLTVDGTAGHGSMIHRDNAITELSEAVGRLGRHEFPIRVTKTLRHFLDELSDALGTELDPENMDETLAKLGGIAKLIGASLKNTANQEEFLADLDRILGPRVRREDVHADKALETTFDGALVDAMQTALSAEDPIARAVPYMLSAGTDAKSFDDLGIRCFGF
ncbi:hypothetical protein ADL27_48945, partial [Streptomyces sp. NRRL F-6602]